MLLLLAAQWYNSPMDKEILKHEKYVKDELQRISLMWGRERDKTTAYSRLLRYHRGMVRNFQHERAIHLGVTFFFGGFTILTWIIAGLWYMNVAAFDLSMLPIFLLAIILTILEMFYVRFYFHLENWTQDLYQLDTEIYESMQGINQ